MTDQASKVHILSPTTVSDDDIAALNAFENARRAEVHPQEPKESVEATASFLRQARPNTDVYFLVVRDGSGNVVASANAQARKEGPNAYAMRADPFVCADHRRRGLGTALVEAIHEVATRTGRTLVIGGTTDRVPAGDAFCRAISAELASVAIIQELDLADSHGDVAPAKTLAPGLVPHVVVGAYPEAMLDRIAAVKMIANDEPSGLALDEVALSGKELAEQQAALLASGQAMVSLFLEDTTTSELVVYTEVAWERQSSGVVHQGGTGVARSHRGRGLAKWAKTEMLRALGEHAPDAGVLRAAADSENDPMIAINASLGFGVVGDRRQWQLHVGAARGDQPGG